MTLDPKRLWAKSKPSGGTERPSMHLLRHLQDVYESARRVLDATQDCQLSAMGLDPTLFRDRLRRCVLLAAAVHDIGKANDHFQGMLLRSPDRGDKMQGIRHEWVTILMLKELKAWLLPAIGGNETDFTFIEWAVAGHHPAHNHESPPRSCPPGAGAEIRFHSDHADFAEILQWLKSTFSVAESLPILTGGSRPLVGLRNVFAEIGTWGKDALRVWEKLKDPQDRRLLAAVKNCLIAADVAGSALPKEGSPDWGRLTQAFADVPQPGDFHSVVNARLGAAKPRPFQQNVADSTEPVTYVKAGCGTGKTLAAYMWAAKNHPTRRLFFCYPTTGTATEGFKDYLFEPDEELGGIGAKLFHSRSSIDHEIILTTGGDSKSADADAAAKADALEMWSTPVVACTVDTVLGIVQNNRKGLFAWPALAQSAFVFDEIHAYDDRLFGALLRFLRDVPGLPCLLMTASLPAPREEALREVLKRFRGVDLTPIEGPKALEELPRYHKLTVLNNDPLKLIAEEVARGGKVLWVSNTVNRVMASADAAEVAGLSPLIYHSRFKYQDRVKRHKAVIDAFDPKETRGVLACTSQVCEMSLDLKGCTLLVTEAAPVPALIQRLGRLNRHAKDGDLTRPFVVLTPENNLPYTPAELEAAAGWLAKLPCGDISQRMLADAWGQTGENPPDLVASAWLDGGPLTTVSELREASPGITVLMEGDLTRLRKASDLGKFTLPMPPAPKAVDWRTRKHKGIPVVADETITYDEMRGAEWRKQ